MKTIVLILLSLVGSKAMAWEVVNGPKCTTEIVCSGPYDSVCRPVTTCR
jgi:hypothetical protein